MDSYTHPTGRWPESVDVVALGESTRADYVAMQLSKGTAFDLGDEVWTLNRGIRVFAADLAFILDEVENEAAEDDDYGKAIDRWLGDGKPLISTRISARLADSGKLAITYPARLVLESFGVNVENEDPYWHNSVPMVLAYAKAIGVKRLRLWGADYTLPDGRVLEADRANCEYWVGRCVQAGMQIGLSGGTTLCNRRATQGQLKIYGLLTRNQRRLREWLQGGPSKLARPTPEKLRQMEQFVQAYEANNLDKRHSHVFVPDNPTRCEVCGIRSTEAGDIWCATEGSP